jgi:hypothetical protein
MEPKKSRFFTQSARLKEPAIVNPDIELFNTDLFELFDGVNSKNQSQKGKFTEQFMFIDSGLTKAFDLV